MQHGQGRRSHRPVPPRFLCCHCLITSPCPSYGHLAPLRVRRWGAGSGFEKCLGSLASLCPPACPAVRPSLVARIRPARLSSRGWACRLPWDRNTRSGRGCEVPPLHSHRDSFHSPSFGGSAGEASRGRNRRRGEPGRAFGEQIRRRRPRSACLPALDVYFARKGPSRFAPFRPALAAEFLLPLLYGRIENDAPRELDELAHVFRSLRTTPQGARDRPQGRRQSGASIGRLLSPAFDIAAKGSDSLVTTSALAIPGLREAKNPPSDQGSPASLRKVLSTYVVAHASVRGPSCTSALFPGSATFRG